jgi:hypothetical protein
MTSSSGNSLRCLPMPVFHKPFIRKVMRAILMITVLLITQMQASVASDPGNFEKPKIFSVKDQRVISGGIYESGKGLPLRFATIELFRKSDLAPVGHGTTDTTGMFSVSTAENTGLILKVSLQGYQAFDTTVAGGTSDVVIPAIYLSIEFKQLSAFTVTSRKPLVTQEVDRLSYDVQADPESKMLNLLDMLRKVPLITVDADDNVKLKNSGSYKVLIDGKESSMASGDPKDLFRSMAANNIQKIEVITTPPAKYDGEGLAGIINIVTVKKKDNGYSGSVGASYKFPNGPWSNANFNLKAGKFGLSAYAGATEYNTPYTTFSYSQQSLGMPLVDVVQHGAATAKSNNEYISTQLSYEIDSLNLITADLAYNSNRGTRNSSIFTNQTIDTAIQSFNLNNSGTKSGSGYDLGVGYQLGFKHNKAQFLNLSYKYTSSKNNQFNNIQLSELFDYAGYNYTQLDKAGTNEHTIQIDYTEPLKTIEIEAGAKAILRNNFSDFTVQDMDVQSHTYFYDSVNSNDFTYQQNVYSIYNSYQLNLRKWTVKAGLRDEMTTIRADFLSNELPFSTNYNNLLPSVAIQDKISKTSSINFGYSDRILRPGILQLNPFVDRQDPLFISFGNPGLKPEVNHSFNVNYGIYKKVSFNFGAGYSFSNNTIEAVSTLTGDGVTAVTFENLGKDRNWTGNVNINIPLTQKLNVSINGQLNYLQLTGTVDSVLYERKGTVGNASLFAGYKFGTDWRAGFTFLYFSPNITLQSTSSPYYYTSLSLSRSMFKKKLTFSASVSNPYLQYLNYKYKTVDASFIQMSNNQIVYRRFNIGINYKFGKLKDGSIRKSKKDIKNDDIKVVPSLLPG